MASCNTLDHLKSRGINLNIIQLQFQPNSTNLVFLLEAEDSGLLLNVDLLQVLPHLHHLAQKKHFSYFDIKTPHLVQQQGVHFPFIVIPYLHHLTQKKNIMPQSC